jgi:hypothetical protein
MKPGGLGSGSGETFRALGLKVWLRALGATRRQPAPPLHLRAWKRRPRCVSNPTTGRAFCVLGMIDAALGRKEDAIREGRRAAELLPVAKDSMGATIMEYLGIIYAWTEKDPCHRPGGRDAADPEYVELRQTSSASVLGPAARRPTFRETRRLARAEINQ